MYRVTIVYYAPNLETKTKIEEHEVCAHAKYRVQQVIQEGLWVPWLKGSAWAKASWAYYEKLGAGESDG